MAENYAFSFIASIQTALYESLLPGDIIELRASTNNIVDPNAVECWMDNTLVGYVANSTETVLTNTRPATNLRRLVSNNQKVAKAYGILRKQQNFVNKSGVEQKRFLAEAFFVPVRNNATQQTISYQYNIGGTSSQNPGKSQMLAEITRLKDAGKPIDIPVSLARFDNGGAVIVRCYKTGTDISAGSGAGQVTDCNATLEKMFETQQVVRGRVVGQGGRSSYIVEVSPDSRSIDKFLTAIDSAIARCVGQAPELEGKTKVMLQSGFPDEEITAVLEQMPSLPSKLSVPNPKVKYAQTGGSNLSDIVAYMLMGKMVRLVGEKGSGKNTLVETACWLMNRPLCRVQGSSELDKLDILGSRTLQDGSTGFELSAMLDTLRDDGVVVIDEANTVRPDVLTLLHSLTDGARAIDVPGYGPVKMGDHACILYTLNEDYVGTGEMNAATIDRGPSIVVEQESDMSAMLKVACPNASPKDIDTCVKVSKAVQKAVKESGTLTADAVTVRGYIDALESVAFIPLKRGLMQNVANKAQTAAERQAITTIIASFCS